MLVNEFLEESTSLTPDKVALIYNSCRLTYEEINRFANSLANALIDAGFRRQDRAIIYLENSIESVVSIFAILKAGGIFVIINPQVKARKLGAILDDCEAGTIITSKSMLSRVSELAKNSNSLKRVVITGVEEIIPSDISKPILLYNKIIKESPYDRPATCCIDIDLAALIYTSGSTGLPKGVMLTHLNITSAASSIIQYLENTSDDIILSTLPLSFDYGLYQLLMSFKFGGTLVLEKAFVYPQHVINLVVAENVTGWPMVPPIASILLQRNNLGDNDFSRLRYITNTGQTMSPRHFDFLTKAFPKTKIFSMYGLTECKRVSFLPPEQLRNRPTSVGKAMPNVEVYLVNDDNSIITLPEKSGELVVRGSNVMKGYWNQPLLTEKYLRTGNYPNEQVLYTGDLFKMDNEGYLYFLGRKDDIIKTGGQMVSPREVENVLCQMEDVIEASVVGVGNEILGEEVVAFVCLDTSSKVGELEIIEFCSQQLEEYAVPKKVIIRQSLPMLSNGKVAKKELKYELAGR